MQQIHRISMNITVNRERLLEKLKENRAKHAQIVKEAKEGYWAEVARRLIKLLEDIREENGPKPISFTAQPPKDYTGEYDTVITMLEYHTEETIQLTPDEARQLLEDRWDWMSAFLETNSAYSEAARALGG